VRARWWCYKAAIWRSAGKRSPCRGHFGGVERKRTSRSRRASGRKNAGWRLIYDPSAVIDHYRGPRFGADQRDRPEKIAIRDLSFNLVAAMLSLEPDRYWRRAVFGLLVGDREIPGVVRAGAALLRREWDVARRLGPSLMGQVDALTAIARNERVSMVTFTDGRDNSRR
jgi:hypothetical protein